MFRKIKNLLNSLTFHLVIASTLFMTSGSNTAIAETKTTCWSGDSQDGLECCVAYSYNLTKDEMTQYYKDNGYGQKNIGGSAWGCKDANDGSTWWNNCNYYWNEDWVGQCPKHDPEEWY